eukprot:2795400-Prymnesium_polylepis.1
MVAVKAVIQAEAVTTAAMMATAVMMADTAVMAVAASKVAKVVGRAGTVVRVGLMVDQCSRDSEVETRVEVVKATALAWRVGQKVAAVTLATAKA